jgi:pyruvate carboxylase subunit B
MFNPVKVTDVTLRDGLEDFVLKYLHAEDLGRLGALLDRAGFYSLDCWGGTTFYAALTEMQEDPRERLRRLRRALSNTPQGRRGEGPPGRRGVPQERQTGFVH